MTSGAPTTGIFTSISVGRFDTACAVNAVGTIMCWGANYGNIISNVPTTGTFASVSVGAYAACAI